MKRLVTLVVVGMIPAGLVACQGAAGLSDRDKAAIREVVEDTGKMMPAAKPDFAAYTAMYYTEDATILAANYPAVKGRAAIKAMFETMPPMSAFKTEIVELDGRGDLAYVRGNYTMTLAPPGAPPITDQGKYIEVWKKGADGTWKASYDSWTSDLPVPEMMLPTGVQAPAPRSRSWATSWDAGRSTERSSPNRRLRPGRWRSRWIAGGSPAAPR